MGEMPRESGATWVDVAVNSFNADISDLLWIESGIADGVLDGAVFSRAERAPLKFA
jgi:hypothetical protein